MKSRWLDWKPKDQKFKDALQQDPTKPTKPGFVGFVASPQSVSSNFLPSPADEPAKPQPKLDIDGKLPPEATQFLMEFQAAGGIVTRVHDLEKPPRRRRKGISMDEWRLQEARRMTAKYLGTLAKLPNGVQPRSKGETAIYYTPEGPLEWVVNPQGLPEATWTQIAEEAARGGRIQVLAWPAGNILFDSTKTRKE